MILCLTNMYPTPNDPSFGCFVSEQVEDLRALGLEVFVAHFDGRKDRLNYARAARFLCSLLARNEFTLIHAHYGLTGAVALTQRRLPVVTTFHGSDYTGQVRWQAYLSRLVARRCNAVCVSKEGALRLRRPDAWIIPSGVDIDRFRPLDRRAARRVLGWKEEARYVLLPGARGQPVKGAPLFDAAVKEARRSAPDLSAKYLEGFSRVEVPLVMNAVNVTLVTSLREGSPVSVRESLACATPVVSVPVGDVPEVIEGLPGCAVQPRDPKALADAVLAALDAKGDDRLRQRAEETSRSRVAKRIGAVYESVLGEKT